MNADDFIQSILRNAGSLRAAGVLRLQVDGCSVDLAPHQPEPDDKDEDEEDDDRDPEHPAFNPKVKLREYHKGNS